MHVDASGKYVDLDTKDFVALEEKINGLLGDKTIKARRELLPNYIKARLRERALARLDPDVFTPALLEGFLQEDKKQTKKLFEELENNKEALQLSGKMILEIKRNAKANRKCALEALKDMLTDRELIRFRKEADIAAKNWIPIINASVIPGEILLERISKHLELKPEQQAEFCRLAIHRVFYVQEPLRKKIHELLKKSDMTAAQFRDYAFIGKDAWESFRAPADAAAPHRKTSQETLLKMAVGFGLEEEEAWAFLETAGGTFAVRIDLVFLACICCGYRKPLWIMEILDFFSVDGEGNTLYANPYY